MGNPKHKPVLSVRIDANLLERIDKLAEVADVGRNEIVERILTVGLVSQEEIVDWIKSPLKGPFMQILSHPTFITMLAKLSGDELDPTSLKLRNAAVKLRKGTHAKPETNK